MMWLHNERITRQHCESVDFLSDADLVELRVAYGLPEPSRTGMAARSQLAKHLLSSPIGRQPWSQERLDNHRAMMAAGQPPKVARSKAAGKKKEI
jgi:hypothetical protein